MAIKVNSCIVVSNDRELQSIANYNSSSENFFAGICSGQSNTTGTTNIFIGSCSGRCNTTGSTNVFFGNNAGCAVTTGTNNTIIGSLTGTSSLSNTLLLGSGTCERIKVNNTGLYVNGTVFNPGPTLSAQNNFFVTNGNPSITATGCNNIAIGKYSGGSLSFGKYNTFLGLLSGTAVSTGCDNFFAGRCAGRYTTTGSFNTFIGRRAGQCNLRGSYNLYVGCDAGRYIRTGSDNIVAGRCALRLGGVSGLGTSGNIVFGAGAGQNFYGDYSGSNIFMGSYAAAFACGSFNFFAGTRAGYASLGSCNIFIGGCAGYGASGNGSSNIFLGFYSGRSFSTGSHNTFFGYYSGRSNTTGSHNLFAGVCAGRSNTTGSWNLFAGQCAGFCNTTGISNIFIGFSAGCCNTIGSNNLLLGSGAGVDSTGLANITTESNRIIMGNSNHTCAQIQVAWTVVSDCRDKHIYCRLDKGRGFLENINPIVFSFKNRETNEIKDIKKRYGFSAQEILQLEGDDPVLVGTDNPDKLGLTSDYLIPILVNAVKELSAEVKSLKSRIEILESNQT